MLAVMTTVIYARVSDKAHAYVRDQADASGVSMAAIVDAILTQAADLGWRMEKRPALLVDTREP